MIALTAVVLVAGAGILYWTLGPPRHAPGQPSASVSDPAPSALAPSPVADPEQTLSRAWKKARAWRTEAALVDLRIEGVTAGRLAENATWVATFAEPTGRMGPGAAVGKGRFIVTARADQLQTREESSGDAALAAPDPDCPVASAWRAAVASGLASSIPLQLGYRYSKTRNRAIWTARAVGNEEQRELDGASCNILAR
ncbi:MAG: hypothetical protein R3B13_24235 [Polyangiaceae bacterium]